MTQEQIKAEELVEKMYENQLLSVKLDKKVLAYELAKQCALIAVDEIINSSPSAPILSDAGSFVNDIEESTDFWKQVKQEILSL